MQALPPQLRSVARLVRPRKEWDKHSLQYRHLTVKKKPLYTGSAKPKLNEHVKPPGVSKKKEEGLIQGFEYNGYILAGRYEIQELLGRGRFGIVRAAYDQAKRRKVAVKVLCKQKDFLSCKTEVQVFSALLENSILERNVLKTARHYMAIPYDIYETERNLYIIMECVSGGDLFDRIVEHEYIEEADFKPVLKGIVEALCILHANGVVHRDVKPENVLLRPQDSSPLGSPVLTDFGLSYVFGKPDMLQKPAGTFGYVCPEILSSANHSRSLIASVWSSEEEHNEFNLQFKCASDVWSLGVLSYASLCGELPYPASMDGTTSVDEHLQCVHAGPKFQHYRWDSVSTTMKDLVALMLHYSPFNRPTVEQIRKGDWWS